MHLFSMSAIPLVLTWVCCIHVALAAPTEERDTSQHRGHVVFHDDFSSGHIDVSKWTHYVSADGVGNHEFQMYTPEKRNSYVKDGVLYIKPTLTVDSFGVDFLTNGTFDARQVYGKCSNAYCVSHGWNEIHPVMSAMLYSTGHIRYGRVEVVAKLPRGDWLWPAFWMMPVDSAYGGWPASGEIDIMESRGNRRLYDRAGHSEGVDLDHCTIHYGPRGSGHKSHGNTFRLHGSTFADAFHTYWIDWTADYLRLGVDGHTVLNHSTPEQGYWQEGHFHGNNVWANGAKNAPFDKPFYLRMNLAVGGDFFTNSFLNEPSPQPWRNGAHDQMMQFWGASHLWYPTWQGEDAALRVKSVTMWQY